ncbi:SgrR family transcriptional regulator [Vibrio comitans]|uniref:Peptide-binding protein n=1 Tax=Vibrio comitans NBRC 102076 TaxID=1219078 RepID=A0A4Y3IRH0_9VIBR|nr:peptide-binding protein [Vibrio comitans NBRC 102076]
MNVEKQILYFSRLAKLGVNKEILTTLPELAETMFTSTRHCRALLKELSIAGWIEWTPKVGRNQRSHLFLNYSLEGMKSELSQQLMREGSYEKALNLIDNDQELFGRLLKRTSGAQQHQGRLHVQLTYNRQFSSLVPHISQRNSERFLLRQVYSCLTRCDELGHIQPDLAHHWNYDEQTLVWRFYLRPYLKFHDGSGITSKVVAELFQQLRGIAVYEQEFSHIKDIRAINPLCIEFELSESDPGLAGLLSQIKYSIQPYVQDLRARKVVGSGMFKVTEHTPQQLTLQAFDDYHGFRALTESITIWQVAEQSSRVFGDTVLQAEMGKQTSTLCSNYLSVDGGQSELESEQRSRIEDGCLLTLVNSRAKLSLSQRKYLSQLVSTERLLKQIASTTDKVEAVPAYNLLPDWLGMLQIQDGVEPLPKKLTIGIFEHKALKKCAPIITELLEQVGVKCTTKVYSFEEFHQRAVNNELNEDLLLTSMNLDENRPISAFYWMWSNPIIHQSLPEPEAIWLMGRLTEIRSDKPITTYLKELEPLASALITSGWVIPMFHHRQTLRFEGVLKNVAMNTWGWPVLQDIWSDENLAS